MLNMAMATRNPLDVDTLSNTTDFVMHKSQQQQFAGIQKKIVDYSEHRLLKYITIVKDLQQQIVLAAMIDDYREGNIAIAWRRGQPVYIRITKDG
jgi:membrane-associated PAP2 superfamily phosphatase